MNLASMACLWRVPSAAAGWVVTSRSPRFPAFLHWTDDTASTIRIRALGPRNSAQDQSYGASDERWARYV